MSAALTRGPGAAARADALVAAAIAALGAAVAWHYGTRGFMPLDQSIVFDGGWRVASGQVPFRDFGTPSGLVPIAMQALAFRAFGVSWGCYVAHASAVNAVYGALAFALLRLYGAPRWLAAVCGAGSTWLLYPPIGTPYAEQHAFAFALAACVAGALSARAAGPRAERGAALAAGALAWLAVASKLNVAAASAPAIACALALAPGGAGSAAPDGARSLAPDGTRAGARSTARGGAERVALAALGAAAAAAATLGALFAAGASPAMLHLYALELPLAAGGPRLARMATAAALTRGLDAPLVAPAATLVAVALAAALSARERARGAASRDGDRPGARVAAPLALATALVASCALFLATVVNQPEIGVAPVFAAAGLAAVGLARALAGRPRARAAALAAVAAMVAVDTARFDRAAVAPRSVLDLAFDPARAERPAAPGLEAMWFQAPRRSPVSARDLDELLAFLRAEPGDFVLVGDHSILYGLAGRPSLSPSLWFHAGLAHPAPSHPARAAWEAALASAPARFAIVEGERTWMGTQLSEIEGLARRVRRPGRRFGGFRVFELAPASPAAPAAPPAPAAGAR
ncbi:MAG: hypothetical protein R3E88_22375 [Myxococcota bacterium]